MNTIDQGVTQLWRHNSVLDLKIAIFSKKIDENTKKKIAIKVLNIRISPEF